MQIVCNVLLVADTITDTCRISTCEFIELATMETQMHKCEGKM